jgi:hypothetical protein
MGRNWVQIWLRKRVLGRVSERFGARLGTKVNVYWGRFSGAFAPGTVPFCGFRVVSVFRAKNWRMENESVLFCK